MRSFNIKLKLILWIVLTIFVFGSLASVLTYYFSKNYILEVEEENFHTVVTLHANQLATVFSNSEQIASKLAEHDDLEKFLADPNKKLQDKKILEILEQSNIEDSYSAIYLMAVDGTTLVSTNPSFVGKNYGFRDYFMQASEGAPYIDVAIGVTSKEPGYYFSAPVFFTGDLVGVLVMKQIPNKIHTLFDKGNSVHDHKMLFIDEYGVIVGSNIDELIYRSLGKLSLGEKESLEKKKRYRGLDIQSLGLEDVQQLIRKFRAAPTPINEVFYRDKSAIEVASVSGTKFLFAIEEDFNKAISAARQASGILSLVIGLMAGLSILVIVILMNRLFIPFNEILEAIKRFSKDKCSKKLIIKTGDEFEVLANEFNAMAKSICGFEKDLQKQSIDLEKKVRDLERVNKAMIGREKKMAEMKQQLKKHDK